MTPSARPSARSRGYGTDRLARCDGLGRDEADEPIVVVITGNGYKTADVMRERVPESVHVGKSLRDFEAVMGDVPVSAGR